MAADPKKDFTKKAVFKTVNPGYLLVSDKPLYLEGEIRRVALEEITEKFGFQYEEDIFLSDEFFDHNFGHIDELGFIWEKIVARLKNPLNEKLVVCFIDEEVGYGVFSKEFIPAGTIIGVYSGEVEISSGQNDYGMSLYPSSVIQHKDLRMNAREAGGIARFIQHMPYSLDKIISEICASKDIDSIVRILDGNGLFFSDEKDLQKIRIIRETGELYLKSFYEEQITALKKIDTELQQEIQTKSFLTDDSIGTSVAMANVQQYPIQFNGKPCLYIQALYDIHPGEQLGVPYGLHYWDIKKCSPKYFDAQGNVIPKEQYLPSLASIVDQYKLRPEFHLPTINTVLRRAAATGNKKDVQFLLEYGAEINSQDDTPGKKKTALHWAAERKRSDIIQLLLYRGADPYIKDANGKTATHYYPEFFTQNNAAMPGFKK